MRLGDEDIGNQRIASPRHSKSLTHVKDRPNRPMEDQVGPGSTLKAMQILLSVDPVGIVAWGT